MKINLIRYSDSNDGTFGLLYIDEKFQCYTLEDSHHEEKIHGKTRIPEGDYEMFLAEKSRFDPRMKSLMGEDYKGMLRLKDVPNFEGILIHAGNSVDDTDGCILLGNTVNNNSFQKPFLGDSREAFTHMYRKVSKALVGGEKVRLMIIEL